MTKKTAKPQVSAPNEAEVQQALDDSEKLDTLPRARQEEIVQILRAASLSNPAAQAALAPASL